MGLELNTTTDKHFEAFQIIPLRTPIQPQNNNVISVQPGCVYTSRCRIGRMKEYRSLHFTIFLTCLKRLLYFMFINSGGDKFLRYL